MITPLALGRVGHSNLAVLLVHGITKELLHLGVQRAPCRIALGLWDGRR